jgi:hypothetical protein
MATGPRSGTFFSARTASEGGPPGGSGHRAQGMALPGVEHALQGAGGIEHGGDREGYVAQARQTARTGEAEWKRTSRKRTAWPPGSASCGGEGWAPWPGRGEPCPGGEQGVWLPRRSSRAGSARVKVSNSRGRTAAAGRGRADQPAPPSCTVTFQKRGESASGRPRRPVGQPLGGQDPGAGPRPRRCAPRGRPGDRPPAARARPWPGAAPARPGPPCAGRGRTGPGLPGSGRGR